MRLVRTDVLNKLVATLMVFVYVRMCFRASVGYPKMLPGPFNDIFALA